MSNQHDWRLISLNPTKPPEVSVVSRLGTFDGFALTKVFLVAPQNVRGDVEEFRISQKEEFRLISLAILV